MTRPSLPNEIEALKDLVITNYQRAEQEGLRANQEHQRAELYKTRLENLTRAHFGSSSEKRPDPAGQQQLFELPAEPEAIVEKPAPDPVIEASPEKKRHGGGRKPLPPELRRERREYTLPEDQRKCSTCHVPMQPFGEEISEQLEYIPSSLHVIEHVRIKYACKCCQEKPAIAPVPDKVVDKGLAGPGLLAWVAVSKFADHQPLYRQESIFARHGVEIARSTQCAWLGTVSELLLPIYNKMADEVKHSAKIHTDDTPVDVLEPGRGKTRTARFWVYVGDEAHPQTVFDYTPSRKRIGPEAFLKGFIGYLQADAYGGYDQLCAGPNMIEVACWAHARRKFFDAKDAHPIANELLDMSN